MATLVVSWHHSRGRKLSAEPWRATVTAEYRLPNFPHNRYRRSLLAGLVEPTTFFKTAVNRLLVTSCPPLRSSWMPWEGSRCCYGFLFSGFHFLLPVHVSLCAIYVCINYSIIVEPRSPSAELLHLKEAGYVNVVSAIYLSHFGTVVFRRIADLGCGVCCVRASQAAASAKGGLSRTNTARIPSRHEDHLLHA